MSQTNRRSAASTYAHLAGRVVDENHLRFLAVEEDADSLFAELVVERSVVSVHVLRGHKLIHQRWESQQWFE